MRYAPIVAFSDRDGSWRVIGVFAVNAHGVAEARVAMDDPLVCATPALKMIETVYNKELEDGEVTFYERSPGEQSSHVERLKTTDPKFLERYGEQLNKAKKFLRLGSIRSHPSENISEHLAQLLEEVRQGGINQAWDDRSEIGQPVGGE